MRVSTPREERRKLEVLESTGSHISCKSLTLYMRGRVRDTLIISSMPNFKTPQIKFLHREVFRSPKIYQIERSTAAVVMMVQGHSGDVLVFCPSNTLYDYVFTNRTLVY